MFWISGRLGEVVAYEEVVAHGGSTVALNSPLQKLLGEWVQTLGKVSSGIVWVDTRHLFSYDWSIK